jgi:cytoskeletal protein RodZ
MAQREQRVTPLELFFDLVLVYAITQVTELMSHDPTWRGVGRGLLVLAALWWAWTGYAWLTNTLEPEEGQPATGSANSSTPSTRRRKSPDRTKTTANAVTGSSADQPTSSPAQRTSATVTPGIRTSTRLASMVSDATFDSLRR